MPLNPAIQSDHFTLDFLLLFIMEEDNSDVCEVCCLKPEKDSAIKLKCQHNFCSKCLKDYIKVLKDYHRLTPSKLQCLHEGCEQEIDDDTLMAIFPGEEGFVLKMIKKCYKESKNAGSVIFSCTGIMTTNRKAIVEKSPGMQREEHSKLVNSLVLDIQEGRKTVENTKTCNNIHIHNKNNLSK